MLIRFHRFSHRLNFKQLAPRQQYQDTQQRDIQFLKDEHHKPSVTYQSLPVTNNRRVAESNAIPSRHKAVSRIDYVQGSRLLTICNSFSAVRMYPVQIDLSVTVSQARHKMKYKVTIL